MPLERWTRRFMETTRGRVVALLRRTPMTVERMAVTLGLTDNAIRSHLATLESDGMVERRGTPLPRTVGKPAVEYRVTDDANELLSRAYLPVLVDLLDELAGRMRGDELRDVMRATGRRMAAQLPPLAGSLRDRAGATARVLAALGAVAELEEHDGTLRIRGYACPLGAAVRRRPEVCVALEALVATLVGAPAAECCDRDERPQCCFAVGAATPAPSSQATRGATRRRGH